MGTFRGDLKSTLTLKKFGAACLEIKGTTKIEMWTFFILPVSSYQVAQFTVNSTNPYENLITSVLLFSLLRINIIKAHKSTRVPLYKAQNAHTVADPTGWLRQFRMQLHDQIKFWQKQMAFREPSNTESSTFEDQGLLVYGLFLCGIDDTILMPLSAAAVPSHSHSC
uniref:AlNc14C276G10045 protein n=1 Tax=Albugo laibachii Nc14 TaxID=890382 RepID=F0WUN8_9STRA|nr:AlNc14C276G10045 [Albugo laibachii Nc14]|eukprot:CCA25119.1 AlNc14C276G10045 [Albugo laibachii Nc14]